MASKEPVGLCFIYGVLEARQDVSPQTMKKVMSFDLSQPLLLSLSRQILAVANELTLSRGLERRRNTKDLIKGILPVRW